MEIVLPYLNSDAFIEGLSSKYAFKCEKKWNSNFIHLGDGRLFLTKWNNFHFSYNNWTFQDEMHFRPTDLIGAKDLVDFRIDANLRISSAHLELNPTQEWDVTSSKGIRLFIPKKFLNRSKKEMRISYSKYLYNSKLYSLITEVFNIDSKDTTKAILIESKLLMINHLWLDFMNKNTFANVETPINTAKEDAVLLVKAIIDEDFIKTPNIKELSKLAGINQSYLKYFFKELQGVTILHYVLEKRMQFANRLLKLTDLPVGVICDKVGYVNRSHFARLYTKYYGEYPSNVIRPYDNKFS